MSQDKMLGKKHEPQCECNFTQHVSAAGEKCNRRYGHKRQRKIEKRLLEKEIQQELDN